MKRYKHFIALTLILIFSINFLSPLHAADGYDNFKVKTAYTGFQDVPSSSWYINAVQIAYERNLMKGSSATTFNPKGNLTVAEAITLAIRLYESYYDIPQTQPSDKGVWYQPFIDKAISIGLINSTNFTDYTIAITRAEFASIFSFVFPFDEETKINSLQINHIPDVDAGTFSSDDVLLLYNLGILTGDNSRRFYPRTPITRAEVATILTRMILPDQRIKLPSNPIHFVEEKHLNRNYDWFVDQNKTGKHSSDNCGPSVTAMTIKWLHPHTDITAEKLRSWIHPKGGWWYTDDIENVFKTYHIPFQKKSFTHVNQLIEEIKNDRLVLVCLDGYFLSQYYSQPESGHFILLKGYTIQNDGTIRFEAYNPDSLKDAYYFSENIKTSIQKWWPYYYSIGK